MCGHQLVTHGYQLAPTLPPPPSTPDQYFRAERHLCCPQPSQQARAATPHPNEPLLVHRRTGRRMFPTMFPTMSPTMFPTIKGGSSSLPPPRCQKRREALEETLLYHRRAHRGQKSGCSEVG